MHYQYYDDREELAIGERSFEIWSIECFYNTLKTDSIHTSILHSFTQAWYEKWLFHSALGWIVFKF